MILGPFALEELVFRLDGVALPVEPRYGLGLLAGQVAALAWLLRERATTLGLLLLVAFSALNLLT